MKSTLQERLAICVAPALIGGIVYEVFLGHRHDYTGHYAAGYGGTLGAICVWLKTIRPERFPQVSILGMAPMCLACILLGAILEATAFRIAKFDEIDFCNQSLGALLAASAAMSFAGRDKPSAHTLDAGLIAAIAFLAAGACFAVA